MVRPLRGAADMLEIIAGERRWRAAQRAGLHEVPVVVIEATDAEALQLAIIENVQRSDLNPLEEADGYRALIDEFGNSQEEIAKIVGKSRSYVANTLRLLKLSDRGEGPYSLRHAQRRTRAHARSAQPDADALAEEIVARGLNVRDVEAMARERAHKSARKPAQRQSSRAEQQPKDADTLAVENGCPIARTDGRYRDRRAAVARLPSNIAVSTSWTKSFVGLNERALSLRQFAPAAGESSPVGATFRSSVPDRCDRSNQ